MIQNLSFLHIPGRAVLLALIFMLYWQPVSLYGQNDFKLVDVKFDSNLCRVALYVKAVKNNASYRFKASEEVIIKELIRGNYSSAPYDSVAYNVVLDKARKQNNGSLKVLFLFDMNGETGATQAIQRNSYIQQIMKELGEPGSDMHYYFIPFGSAVPDPAMLDNAATLDAYLTPNDSFADLHAALIKAAQFAGVGREKCAIFLFSNGKNQIDPDKYRRRAPYTESDVLDFYSKLSPNVNVFPIAMGFGLRDSLLRNLVTVSTSKIDTFSSYRIPPNLRIQLGQNSEILYNNIFYVKTAYPIYQAEPRAYELRWIGGPRDRNSTRKDFTKGSFNSPEALCGEETGLDWTLRWLLGLGLVAGLLGIFAIAIPAVDKRNFYKKYVVRYRKQQGVTHSDPLTGDPIQEHELVVVKCPRQLTTLATWEYVKNQCPNYPRCLDFQTPCDGAGAPTDRDKFFSGKGMFRRLNWVWFGMVGGFIGWSLFALFKHFGLGWYNNLLFRLFSGLSKTSNALNISALADDTLLGTAFGAGICFTLSWVEERSQPRKISWIRIALRTILGTLLSFLVFFSGFYLQSQGIIPNATVAALLTWLFFGLMVGMVLSVESSISLWRGVLGGVIAALLAFGLLVLMSGNFGLAKLLSFILMGAVLGFTLVTVIARLEDFELEYISPETFRQTNPISKWLKNGIDIFIGREPGNYVYVKWEDPVVEPYHARLFYDKGVVYIEPLAETLVNGKMLQPKTNMPLRNGDLIQLGRNSISRMRYKEKRSVNAAGQGPTRR